MRVTSRIRTRSLLVVFGVFCGLAITSAGARAEGGGNVLPSTAMPQGVSLAAMSESVVLFTISGNNPTYYPTTPFQILYATNNQNLTFEGTTISVTGGNTFTVPPGTSYYVPIQGVDNTPPVTGGFFPTSLKQAVAYIFDPLQNGGSFEIIVDGKVTTVGPNYLVLTSPIPLPADIVAHLASLGVNLPIGFCYQAATIGVFLTPMSVGTHTVTIKGVLSGTFIGQAYDPFTTFMGEFTYTVNVVPAHGAR